MTRVRVVSLRYFDYPVASLSPKAFRAWAMAMQWSCYHATDGLLSADDIEAIGAKPAQLEELFKRRLLELDEQGRTVLSDFRHGPVVAEVEGREVGHGGLDSRKPASIRQARWREKSKRLPASTQPSTNVDSQSSTLASTETSTQPSTDSDIPPDPPQIHGLYGSSPNPGSSSTLSSSPKDLTGSARVAKRRPKVIEKAEPLAADFRPPDAAWKATIEKLECADRDLERQLPDFRYYWIEGKGRGKARTLRGWVQAWMNRMSWLAERGQMHLTRSGIQAVEEHRRPYHEPFKQEEPEGPTMSRAETLAALQAASAGIGRRMPA